MSIGAELAAARRQAGLNVAQVSQQTRIREPIIQAIERDDFSACGADFYARGHIRAIAHAIGVDPEPLVREYDSRLGAPDDRGEGGRARRAQRQASSGAGPGPPAPDQPGQRRKRAGAVALLVVLVVAIGLVVYHAAGTPHKGGPAAAAHVPATARHAHKHTKPARSARHHGARNMVISVTAVSQPCWAQLTTRGGRTVFQGIIGPGTSKRWTERRAVTLMLGNPAAVTLRVDGKRHAPFGPNPVTLSLAPRRARSG
jgi:cytoskeletal protein RodZ